LEEFALTNLIQQANDAHAGLRLRAMHERQLLLGCFFTDATNVAANQVGRRRTPIKLSNHQNHMTQKRAAGGKP